MQMVLIALKGQKQKKMSQSLSKVYVHITFSTKNRQLLIDDTIKDSLFEYLGGICKGLECNPVKVGGHHDHIHILCLLSRKVPQMKLLEEIKKNSSKWIKTKSAAYSDFYWQDGYGIFSVNPSEVDVVVKYISNQEEHHKKQAFQEEFRAFLKKYGVEFDERYVWD
jgi:putative transposase